MKEELWRYEDEAAGQGFRLICGVDEAGRGPLAGPVYAAAVILPRDAVIEGLNDSKKLSAKRRDRLYDEIREKATAYCVASASLEEIEELNILWADMLAMRRAVEGLSARADLALIDGDHAPELEIPALTIVHGDALSASIAAASILAKVERDRLMVEYDAQYPEYGFARHKGYPTPLHYQQLAKYGPCPIHRRGFKLIK